VGGAGGDPAIRAWVISATGVELVAAAEGPNGASAPNDHFAVGPDSCVTVSRFGCVGDAGGCPTILAGVVSPAGVQLHEVFTLSPPYDHFTVGPDPAV